MLIHVTLQLTPQVETLSTQCALQGVESSVCIIVQLHTSVAREGFTAVTVLAHI